MSAFAAAAAVAGPVIGETFGIDAVYASATATIDPLRVIETDEPAASFPGPGATLRSRTLEIQQDDMPFRPEIGATLSEIGGTRVWRINQVTRRDDVGAWDCSVEALA